MGASISKKDNKNGGTLGGFVTLNNGDVGFLTCAHVLCDLSGQCDLSASFDVVQPSHGVTGTNEVCGIHQNSICTSSGPNGCTIDAAVVKLTQDRIPERGLFAELTVATLEDNGYGLDNLPEYSTGDVRDSEEATRKMLPCVKWGAATGFTKGLLRLEGTAARWINEPITHTNLFSQTSILYYNQLEIQGMSGTSFAGHGDSGALVFQIDPAKTETEDHQLHCIGMVVGGMPDVKTIVTPIQPILDAFQVQMHKFTPERMDDT